MNNEQPFDPTEREQNILNEGRVIRAEQDVIIPLIREQREAAVSEIVWEFKKGDKDKVFAAAARLAALEDMRATVTNKIKKAEIIERKIFAQQKGTPQ